MISYDPLFASLEEFDIKISHLRDKEIHGELAIPGKVIRKINAGEHVSLLQIERICIILDVPIEKVVRITRD